jgi:hypothetical protein
MRLLVALMLYRPRVPKTWATWQAAWVQARYHRLSADLVWGRRPYIYLTYVKEGR